MHHQTRTCSLIALGLALLFLAARPAHAQQLNILFIGNSFTFRHDLPELVQQVITAGREQVR